MFRELILFFLYIFFHNHWSISRSLTAGYFLYHRIQFNSEEQWTKALKFMLTNLKWGLAWVSSQFTDKWKDFHQITRATATQGIVLIDCLICFYFAFCDSSERNAYPEASASAKPASVAVQREGEGRKGSFSLYAAKSSPAGVRTFVSRAGTKVTVST